MEICNVIFDESKDHAWINGTQYVSLSRFIDLTKRTAAELDISNREIKRLNDEVNAYKVLLKEKLN